MPREGPVRTAVGGLSSRGEHTTHSYTSSPRENDSIDAEAAALVQLQSVLITSPAELWEQITARSGRAKASQCSKLRPDTSRISDPTQAAEFALRSLDKTSTD